jgi:TetR/AcrR family acrAB operon transcriptional repressor
MARKTKAEAQATRSSLIEAAEHLFLARGVSHTSLQDIAQAAGVTRGAVYWHFRDKVDLFDALMERVRLPIEEPVDDAEPARDAAALKRLRRLLLSPLRHAAGDERVRRAYEIALHKVEYVGELASVRERRLQANRDYLLAIEQHLRRAGLTAAQATRHARGLHALVTGLVQSWMLAPEDFDLVADGTHAIDIQLAALPLTRR